MSNVVSLRAKPNELRCSCCGATATASCDCGVAYMPAGELAKRAVEANPEKSNRAIAAKLGVSRMTVVRARLGGTNVPPEKRLGLDGKVYSLPVRSKPIHKPELPFTELHMHYIKEATKDWNALVNSKTRVKANASARNVIGILELLIKEIER